MTDFLTNLVQQTEGTAAMIQPNIAPIFAPAPSLLGDATAIAAPALAPVPPALDAWEPPRLVSPGILPRPFSLASVSEMVQPVVPEDALPDVLPDIETIQTIENPSSQEMPQQNSVAESKKKDTTYSPRSTQRALYPEQASEATQPHQRPSQTAFSLANSQQSKPREAQDQPSPGQTSTAIPFVPPRPISPSPHADNSPVRDAPQQTALPETGLPTEAGNVQQLPPTQPASRTDARSLPVIRPVQVEQSLPLPAIELEIVREAVAPHEKASHSSLTTIPSAVTRAAAMTPRSATNTGSKQNEVLPSPSLQPEPGKIITASIPANEAHTPTPQVAAQKVEPAKRSSGFVPPRITPASMRASEQAALIIQEVAQGEPAQSRASKSADQRSQNIDNTKLQQANQRFAAILPVGRTLNDPSPQTGGVPASNVEAAQQPVRPGQLSPLRPEPASAHTQRAANAAQSGREAAPIPTIRVHIGRVDVRAIIQQPATSTKQRAMPRPALTLDQYLEQRKNPKR